MKYWIPGSIALVMAASGAGVSAQVLPPKPVCKAGCGGVILIEFECDRLEVCCGPIINCATGLTAGTCCPSSPYWCCDADFDANWVPYAECYECDPV